MVTVKEARKMAMALGEVTEAPHFHKTSFRVRSKIFATIDEKEKHVCVFLSLVDQSAFCAYDKEIMCPVPNAWGKKGATYIFLDKVSKSVFKDALRNSYNRVMERDDEQKLKRKKKKSGR